MSGINEQLALIKDALARARGAGVGGTPIDIAVARQYGDSTVTMRAQVLGSGGSQPVVVPPTASAMAGSAAAPLTRATDNSFYERDPMQEDSEQVATTGVKRTYTTNSFYQDQEAEEVPKLLAEIDRLKRKALSRGVNLTSPQEDVPAEDVAMLKQVFAIADDDGSGEISLEQLKQLHIVLGEPLTDEEAKRAFKAMDSNRSGTVSFDDFLAWYTLAHSRSGMLSKKGNAYTARFKKIMQRLGDAFDVKHLTTFTSGVARSLDFRVQFHYNDNGQLKQISPWHDIPLFSPDGYVHMVTEIPKFSRAKFEIATGENFNPIKQDVKNGKLRDYNYGDMCFNYGALPQTWEDPNHTTPDTGYPGDNDPIDAIEIGYRMLRTGSVTRVKVCPPRDRRLASGRLGALGVPTAAACRLHSLALRRRRRSGRHRSAVVPPPTRHRRVRLLSRPSRCSAALP